MTMRHVQCMYVSECMYVGMNFRFYPHGRDSAAVSAPRPASSGVPVPSPEIRRRRCCGRSSSSDATAAEASPADAPHARHMGHQWPAPSRTPFQPFQGLDPPSLSNVGVPNTARAIPAVFARRYFFVTLWILLPCRHPSLLRRLTRHAPPSSARPPSCPPPPRVATFAKSSS